MRFGMSLTSSGSRSKPYFFTLKRLTWYIFRTHINPTGKIQDLLENSESKGGFS